MVLPDFCHKFLPGYVGGVQEGAVTPAGDLELSRRLPPPGCFRPKDCSLTKLKVCWEIPTTPGLETIQGNPGLSRMRG